MKAAFLLFAALIATEQATTAPQGGFDLTPSVSKLNFSKRWNNFDFELLKIMGERVNGNFMISPASIKSVLVMLLEGARGNCAKELRETLRLPSDQAEVRFVLGDYLARLQKHTPGVNIEAANKVFVSDKYGTNSDYENILARYYSSQTQAVNFANPTQAANIINNWVRDKTHNQITDLVDSGSLDVETVIVLVNALYFKGKWENSFDAKLTSNKCFYSTKDCVNAPMMELQTELNYATIDDINAQVVELPYQGGNYSMMIVLPMENDGVSSLHKDFSQSTLSLIQDKMEKTDVDLVMPKFTIDYFTDVTSVLKKMGIQDLFTKNADLSNMINSHGRPQVNSVVHKTRIQVDEQGSIAAAATGAMVIPLMGSTTARMVVDHPFLFIIRETHTGAILFAGKVEQPDPPSTTGAEYQTTNQNRPPTRRTQSNSRPQRVNPNTQNLYSNNPSPVKTPVRQHSSQPVQREPPNFGKDENSYINTVQQPQNSFLQSSNPQIYIGKPQIRPYNTPQYNVQSASVPYNNPPENPLPYPIDNSQNNRNFYNLPQNYNIPNDNLPNNRNSYNPQQNYNTPNDNLQNNRNPYNNPSPNYNIPNQNTQNNLNSYTLQNYIPDNSQFENAQNNRNSNNLQHKYVTPATSLSNNLPSTTTVKYQNPPAGVDGISFVYT